MASRSRWVLIALATLSTALVPTAAHADGSSATLSNADLEEGAYLFVPDLGGEFSVSYETEGRLARRGDSLAQALPPITGNLVLGYEAYFDPWGRLNAGPYLSAGSSLGSGGGTGTLSNLGFGFTLDARLMNADFVYFHVGLLAEAGVVSWSGAPDTLGGAAVDVGSGWRATAGLSTGLGFLTWLDPYVWFEVPTWVGVEYMNLGGYEVWSLAGGLRMELDFAHRP